MLKTKPAEQQVMLHLFHQLPLGPDREQDLQKARPGQPLRRDRGAAEIAVKRLKRVIDHLPDLSHLAPRRDTSLQIDMV